MIEISRIWIQISIMACSTTEKRHPIEQYCRGDHPTVAIMVHTAVKNMNEPRGSSLQAIKKYMASIYKVDSEKLSTFIKKQIRFAVATGTLIQTKGVGLNGSFKVPKEPNKKQKVIRKKKPSGAKQAAGKDKTKKAEVKKTPVTKNKETTVKKTPITKKAEVKKTPNNKKVTVTKTAINKKAEIKKTPVNKKAEVMKKAPINRKAEVMKTSNKKAEVKKTPVNKKDEATTTTKITNVKLKPKTKPVTKKVVKAIRNAKKSKKS